MASTYTKKKIDDHSWIISYTDDNDPIDSVYLLDYKLDTLQELQFDDSSITVGVVAYGDGPYVIKVIKESSIVNYVTIVDFSNAFACYKALFKYILCKCSDPCNDCDESMRARRYDMNAIMGLVEALREMIYLEDSQNIGIYSMSRSRASLIDEMGMMIDKLNIITDRCGLCDEHSTNILDE